MAHGNYKALTFQAWLDDARWKNFVGADELVIGIDVAKTAFYGAVMTKVGGDCDVIYFERPEITEFVESIGALGFKQCTLVVEPSGTYCDGLLEKARQHGLTLIRINGEQVSNAKTIFDGVPSLHDGKAAHILGHLYLCGVGSEWKEHSQTRRDLRALSDMDELMEKTEQMFIGPLEALVARYWPELTDYFDLKQATLLELLMEFTTPQAVCDDPKGAEELMRAVGGHTLKEEKIRGVIDSSRDSTGVVAEESEKEYIRYLAGMLREAQRRARAVEKRIEDVAKQEPATSSLADFAGARTAVVLVGMLGELTNYDSPQKLEKAQGLNLCEHSTGQTLAQKRKGEQKLRISKRGPGRVRKMMYWLAMRKINPQSKSYCPIATAWYHERLSRNGGDGLQGLVALMRKLVRAVWWVARGKEYDGTKLFDVDRLQRLGHL